MWLAIGLLVVLAAAAKSGGGSAYDRGFADGRAGRPAMENCFVNDPANFNRNMTNPYCRGFWAGQQARINAGGD